MIPNEKFAGETFKETSNILRSLKKKHSAGDCVLPSDCEGNQSLRYQQRTSESCEGSKFVARVAGGSGYPCELRSRTGECKKLRLTTLLAKKKHSLV